MARVLDVDLRGEPQALPRRTGGQREPRLANLAGYRTARIHPAAPDHVSGGVAKRQAKDAGYARDAVVREPHDQSRLSLAVVGPNPRRTNAVPDPARDRVDRLPVRAVRAIHVLRIFGVPVPERPVVDAEIHHVG